MARSTNVFGRAQTLMALTPILPGEEEPLGAFLAGLRDPGPSPLARNGRTHVARFVVVPDLPEDPSALPDHLDLQYLLFTTVFDGDRESYLDELVAALEPEAAEIWGRCVGCPRPPRGGSLKAYLKANQLDAGFFFAAYGDATLAEIRRALDKRERLVAFMLRTQGLEGAALQRAFVEEFAP